MRNPFKWLATLVAASLAVGGTAFSQEDPGRGVMGRVSVSVYYATNGDPAVAGSKATEVSKETEKQLRAEESLRFAKYRLLGRDVEPLLRSYESWAEPFKPSEDLMVRFEARSEPTPEVARLDVELWLKRKKIVKADARLQGNRPLFILGPEWRGGRLIVSVVLLPDVKEKEKAK